MQMHFTDDVSNTTTTRDGATDLNAIFNTIKRLSAVFPQDKCFLWESDSITPMEKLNVYSRITSGGFGSWQLLDQ